jgi:DNA polymerase elongation subunit (family B)
VYQESINKYFDEFLVNYDYLDRAMENYGFTHLTAEECKSLGLPKSSGLFSELYDNMVRDVEKNKKLANDYGKAIGMNVFEKKISFLNRYFVYKKVRNVDASRVQLEGEEEEDELPVVASNTFEPEVAEEEDEVTVVLKPKTTKKKKTVKLPISLVIDEEEN